MPKRKKMTMLDLFADNPYAVNLRKLLGHKVNVISEHNSYEGFRLYGINFDTLSVILKKDKQVFVVNKVLEIGHVDTSA